MPILDNVPVEIKTQLKEQRLRNLSIMWYDKRLNKIAFEAQGATQEAAREQVEMDKLELSYQTIQQLED